MSDRPFVPTDLERERVAAPDEAVVQVAPAAEPLTPAEWVRRNLFSSWWQGLLTVVTTAAVSYVTFRLVRFVFVSADWTVLKVNFRNYLTGRFPVDQLWRVWASLYLVLALAGLSRGAFPPRRWSTRTRVVASVLALLGVGALLYLVDTALVWMLLGGGALLLAASTFLGRRIAGRSRWGLVAAWGVGFVAMMAMLSIGGVKTDEWGGLLLNLIVAAIAIFFSFPIGVLLALGRRSSLPVISRFCVGVIELIRGVPLLTLLIFGRFVLPLLLPPGLELPQLIRAMIMITLFSAVYIAEIVRGGLQGIPRGQYEAADALGLSRPRTLALVAMPQALRSTIPPMIGHFISVFKDTSLLAALDIFADLLDTALRVTNELRFVGEQAEALLPAAFLFWMIAFTMSRWSQRVERRLGVGER